MVQSSPQIIIPTTRPKGDTAWWHTLEKNIRLGIGREKVLQEQQLTDVARAEAEVQRKTVNGLGQLSMIIPQSVYLHWHLSEPGCWNDKEFKRKFRSDNAQVRASKPEKKYI